MTFTQFVERLLVKQIPPTYTRPTLSVSSNIGLKFEMGKTINPTIITKYNKTFQLLPDREVKEIYDTIDVSEPKGTKIIIVDGIEKGAYWLTTEYMKDNA